MAEQPESFNKSEIHALRRYLQSSQRPLGTLNLTELHGYLFCVCTLPELVPAPQWLPPVFANELPQIVGREEDAAPELLLRLHNQVAHQVQSGSYRLPATCRLSRNMTENFLPGNGLHDWSYGFGRGLQYFVSAWEPYCDDEQVDVMLNEFWTLLTFFGARSLDMIELDPDELEPGTVAGLRKDMPGILTEYSRLSRNLYTLVSDGDQQVPEIPEPVSDTDDNVLSFPGAAPSKRIDGLIDAALGAKDVEEARNCARQILEIDSDCLDGYLLMAEFETSPAAIATWLQLAVQAGERTLGSAFFEEHSGVFWGLVETRPYMRALSWLGETYRELGEFDKSIAAFERCLTLNPNDNQGVRYLLIAALLQQGKLDQAATLIADYAEEATAFISYSRALLTYAREGDSKKANAEKRKAREQNKHVPKLLAGRTKMPRTLPGSYGFGGKEEAVCYVDLYRQAWRNTRGAVGWLLR